MVIQAPANSGSLYLNYKATHSILLLAVCDAQYRYAIIILIIYDNYIFRFILIDVGQFGHHSDRGMLSNS